VVHGTLIAGFRRAATASPTGSSASALNHINVPDADKAPRTGADWTMPPSDFRVGMAGTLEQ
ncbi:MAG: hypothetical protein O7G13_06850, partial [Alphaproteobacteria bacterium]|nr:hypothetical protein [Alphaproteobacteria bacterium]